MEIQLEQSGNNAIQAYSETEIKIANTIYTESLLVNKNEVFANWPIKSIEEIDEDNLNKILKLEPAILILGLKNIKITPPFLLLESLSKLKIGLEYMSFGAACRTFNILLSEERNVVGGFIF